MREPIPALTDEGLETMKIETAICKNCGQPIARMFQNYNDDRIDGWKWVWSHYQLESMRLYVAGGYCKNATHAEPEARP